MSTPTNFEERPVIGHILGEPVYGEQSHDIVGGALMRYTVSVTLNGLTLDCDNGRLCIHEHPDALQGMPLRDVAALVELWQSGAIHQLAEISRVWLAETPPEPILTVEEREALVAAQVKATMRRAVALEAARAVEPVTVTSSWVEDKLDPKGGYTVVDAECGSARVSWDPTDLSALTIGCNDATPAELRQLRAVLNHPAVVAIVEAAEAAGK